MLVWATAHVGLLDYRKDIHQMILSLFTRRVEYLYGLWLVKDKGV